MEAALAGSVGDLSRDSTSILRDLLPEEARGFSQPRELGEAGNGEVRPKGTRLCVHSSFFPSLDWVSVAVSVSETQEGL